ncbi:MAG: hypothetical protein ACOCV1_05350 [Bacillota bacterium]
MLKNILILFGLIFLIITFPLLIPIIINYILIEIFYLPTIDIKTWISFFGSYSGGIITGFITLYVLYMTLKKNSELQFITLRKSRELHDEKTRLSIMPYLVFESILFNEEEKSEYKVDFDRNFIFGNKNYKNQLSKHEILIKIKNIGLGNIVDLKINTNKTKLNKRKSQNSHTSNIYTINAKNIQTSINVLPKNEEKICKIVIKNYKKTKIMVILFLWFLSFRTLLVIFIIKK